MVKKHKRYILYILIILLNFSGCFDSNKPHISVSTENDKKIYNEGENIIFKIKLEKGDMPIANANINVYDYLSCACKITKPTDIEGITYYEVKASKTGIVAFGFDYSPEVSSKTNYVVEIRGNEINPFKILNDELFLGFELGEKKEIDLDKFMEDLSDVSKQSLKEMASDPIWTSTTALCVGGTIASATGIGVTLGGGMAAMSCPVAWGASFSSIFVFTRNYIKKLDISEEEKQSYISLTENIELGIIFIQTSRIITESYKGGKAMWTYITETPSGKNALNIAFKNILDFIGGVSDAGKIINHKIEMIQDKGVDKGFVLTFNTPSKNIITTNPDLEESDVITIGIIKERENNCKADELLKKNNITRLVYGSESNYYVDLNKMVYISKEYSKNGYIDWSRDIKLKYQCYNGHFTSKNEWQKLVEYSIEGDFSHVEGFGLYDMMLFDNNDKLIYDKGLSTRQNHKVDKVVDIDDKDYSYLLVYDGACFQGCYNALYIYYGNLDKPLFERTVDDGYFLRDEGYELNFTAKYNIEDNKLIFNSELSYYDHKGNKNPFVKKFKDIYTINNGRVEYMSGDIPDVNEFLKKYKYKP